MLRPKRLLPSSNSITHTKKTPKKSLYKLQVDTVILVKTTFVCWCVPDHEQTTYKVFHKRGIGSGRCHLSALRTYLVIGVGGGNLNGKKGHDVWDFSLAYPLFLPHNTIVNSSHCINKTSLPCTLREVIWKPPLAAFGNLHYLYRTHKNALKHMW